MRTEEPFSPGSVTGRAQALRFGGFTGGTEFALTLAIAIGRAQGAQGNAQSQALELGIFGLILSQPNECTGEPFIAPEELPQPLRADSVHGERSETNVVGDGELFRGAREHARAAPGPEAYARTEIAEVDLSPVLLVQGLASEADARISEASRMRSSEGIASVGSIDIAGIVRMEGLRWYAGRQTGDDELSHASFTVGRLLLADTELATDTPEDLAVAFEAVNTVIGPLGVTVEPPAPRERGDGSLEMTGLAVKIGGTDTANPLLGPLLAELQPVRDIVFEAVQSSQCPVDPGTFNGLLTVLDVMLAALSGAGGLVFEFGGVRSTHDTAFYENPFGAPIPPGVASFDQDTGTAVPGEAAGAETVRAASPAEFSRQAADLLTRCETTHPSGSPGCSRSWALLAGALSLLIAVGLFTTDALRTRRRPGGTGP